jgi:hypothetical protein
VANERCWGRIASAAGRKASNALSYT